MNSKTSLFVRFFSIAGRKSDLRDHWPWPVAASVLLFFNLLGAIDAGRLAYSDSPANYSLFINRFFFSFFVSCVYGFLIGTKLFMYLDKMNSVSCIHGLPFSRKKLYLSHILSGFILFALPAVFITASMFILGVPFERTLFTPGNCAAFLGIYLIYSFISFAIAVFSMTICGNVIISMLLSCGIVVLPAAFIGFFQYVLYSCVYGYTGGDFLLEILLYLYILPSAMFPVNFLVYVVGAILLITAGFFIYKIRPLENCEEVVAFRRLRWLFITTVGVVLGMISYMFFAAIFNYHSLLLTLPLGLVGVIAASMFARKTVSLRGSGRYIIAYIAVAFVLTAGLKHDIFGYERRIPSEDSIQSVELSINHRNAYYNIDVSPDYKVTSEEDIEKIRALHSAYISEKGNEKAVIYNDVTFTYRLKNGLSLKREYYHISQENYDKYMTPVLNIDKVKSMEYPLLDNVEKEILNITVYDDMQGISSTYAWSEDAAKELYDALMYDLENNKYEDLQSSGTLSVEVSYYVPGTYRDKDNIPETLAEKNELAVYCSMNITSHYTKTLEVLKKNGFYTEGEYLLPAIKKVIVEGGGNYETVYSESSDGVYIGTGEAYEVYTGGINSEITDPEDIKTIYELCIYGFEGSAETQNNQRYYITFINENDEIIFSRSYNIIIGSLPENLQKYFRQQ